jgi:hypothetical protein
MLVIQAVNAWRDPLSREVDHFKRPALEHGMANRWRAWTSIHAVWNTLRQGQEGWKRP